MDTELLTWAKQIYPAAVLWIGERTEARHAVIEAAAAAKNNSQDALPALLRIGRLRATEHPQPSDIPAPLSALLRLPPSSRRDYAFRLCGMTVEELAAAKGITPEEQEQKTEKAIRQMTFLQSGLQPEQLQAELHRIAWTDTDTAALTQGLAQAAKEAVPPAPEPPPIQHRKNERFLHGETVTIPIWALIMLFFSVLLLAAALVMFIMRREESVPMPVRPTEAVYEPEDIPDIPAARFDYLSLKAIQEKAAQYIGKNADSLVFLLTKLRPDDSPASYELTVLDPAGTQYEYRMKADNGELISQRSSAAKQLLHTGNWLPAAKMRKEALAQTGLTAADAFFLKEKLGTEGDSGYYKYELLDTAGRVYTVQLDAVTGVLVGYEREEPAAKTPEKTISADEACLAALQQTGAPDPAKVLFTRIKPDGAVYLIAFTLDNGTQYNIEIDAVTGMANTIDIHPAPEDLRKTAGMMKAFANACQKAGLAADAEVRCTKAKIDRSSGAYVYELEFENAGFEYEATVLPETGEVVKFRVWAK